MLYVGMIEAKSLKMLLKSFHENYSDLFIKITRYYGMDLISRFDDEKFDTFTRLTCQQVEDDEAPY